jgi:hypothetical protein
MTERDTKQPGAASGWSLQPLFSAWPPPTQPDFSPLQHPQQATLFGGFGGGIPPQDTLFGGFVTPTPEKAKTKKEEIKNNILKEVKTIKENILIKEEEVKTLEDKVKKHVVKKIKENCKNVVELSRKHKIPIKNIMYSFFVNNRIDNIEIVWSASSIKEFRYVPIKHYIEFEEDTLYLKTKQFKFKKSF